MSDPFHQFMIKPLISLQVGRIDISLTNAAAFMLAATGIIIAVIHVLTRRPTLIPNRSQAFVELLYSNMEAIIFENIGPKGMVYFPFLFSLFLFVAMGNLLGMLPYGFTYTGQLIINFALAMIIFGLVWGIGLRRHGWRFFTLFAPPGAPKPILVFLVPIEIISFFIRPITLSVRLFTNMLVGHILLKLFAGFALAMGIFGVMPILFNVAMIGFEFFVAIIQAFIFTVLSCLYLREAIYLH